MIIKSLKLKNFKLLKDVELSFDKINIIKGENYSGKSTLLKSIIFGLYGEASGTILQKLVSFDEKECSAELNCSQNNEQYKIIRKIPNNLQILENGINLEFNTPTIAQNYLNKQIKDYEFFKKYRLINKQSINLLDYAKDSRSISTLRKEIMNFIDTDFDRIRKKFIRKKLNRERYSIDKKLYKFYLSTKRKDLLESGLIRRQEIIKQTQNKIDKQYNCYNDILVGIQTKENEISNYDIASIKKQINDFQLQINNYTNSIVELNKIKNIEYIDYEELINKIQKKIETINIDIDYLENEINNRQSENNNISTVVEILKTDSKKNKEQIIKTENEITEFQLLDSKSKCDKCGAQITKSNKEIFVNEKTEQIQILLQEQKNIELKINEKAKLYDVEQNDLSKLSIEIKSLKKELQNKQTEIRTLNEKNTEQSKIKEQISLKGANIKKYTELIEVAKKQITQLNETINKMTSNIEQSTYNIEQLKKQLKQANVVLDSYKKEKEIGEKKVKRTNQYLIKLNEAFKFSDYRYDKSDIVIYDESIKEWDNFAGWYIQNWLDSLTFIINDMLSKIGLSVIFSADKQFLTITEEGRDLDYSDLSSGQQIFLSVIFKLAILLQNNIVEGIVIIDEGINELKLNNVHKLIDILKSLPFQVFLIYQNIDEIEDVKQFIVIRQNGVSKVD